MFVNSMRGGPFTVRFEAVKYRTQRTVPCDGGCGRKLKRSVTFEQTINPFNTNAEGEPKSYGEIMVELKAKAAAWEPESTCKACTEAAAGAA